MNYTIGLSSETLRALSGLGNFGWDKVNDLYLQTVQYLQVYYGTMIWVVGFACVVFFLLLIMGMICHEEEGGAVLALISLIVLSILLFIYFDTRINLKTVKYQAIQKTIELIKKNM